MPPKTIVFGLTVPFSTILFGDLFTRMLDSDWQVHLVIGEEIPSTFIVDPRIVIHLVPMKRKISPFADLRALLQWYRKLRSISPTICVGATPKAGMLSMISSRLARTPHRIYQVWGAKWDGMRGPSAWILRKADAITASCSTETLACSNSMAELMVIENVLREEPRVLGYGGTKGVDLKIFTPADYDKRDDSSSLSIGFVGRLATGKGVDALLPLFRDLKAEFPQLTLDVVGEPDSADPLDATYLDELSLEPGVHMHGHQRAVAQFLRRMDVFVFPSLREGLPNVVIEAAACGVPAVAWDVTGSRDAIVNGVSGYLIPPGDYQAMRRAVATLLNNVRLRHELGGAASLLAQDRFDSRKVIGAQIVYFESLMNS
jgi:glycosyltransferase involved in cell wall biosynthesis